MERQDLRIILVTQLKKKTRGKRLPLQIKNAIGSNRGISKLGFFFPILRAWDSAPGMPVETSKSGRQEASGAGPPGSCGWEWNTFTSNLVKRMHPSFTLVIKTTWYSFMLIYSESCQLMVMFSQLLSQL